MRLRHRLKRSGIIGAPFELDFLPAQAQAQFMACRRLALSSAFLQPIGPPLHLQPPLPIRDEGLNLIPIGDCLPSAGQRNSVFAQLMSNVEPCFPRSLRLLRPQLERLPIPALTPAFRDGIEEGPRRCLLPALE